MNSNKKIYYNTVFLYAKLLVASFSALISTKIVLETLGIEDFGIFNVVAGVVVMLSFLNGAMSVTTQRFLSFHLGKGNQAYNKVVFQTSRMLHSAIAIIIVIAMELLCNTLFDSWLSIPQSRLHIAKYVFHFMVVSTFFTISAVPFDSIINSYEHMFLDSLVGIAEAIAKLLIALLISNIDTGFDPLLAYSALTAGLIVIVRFVKSIWCWINYAECRGFSFYLFDGKLLKEMGTYASWSLFGSLCYVATSQGTALILNNFIGAKINATYALANQVNSQMLAFSVLMTKAANPQIMKSEGGGNRTRMLDLSLRTGKFASFALMLLIIPFLCEMPFILRKWLDIIPSYSIIFCSLILVNSLINQMSIGLKSIVQATGKIKSYQTVVGSTIILILPLSYFALDLGFPPYSVLLCGTFIELLSLALRVNIVSKITDGMLDKNLFVIGFVLKIVTISLVTYTICKTYHLFLGESFVRLGSTFVLSTFTSASLIYTFALDNEEKQTILKIKRALIQKLQTYASPS